MEHKICKSIKYGCFFFFVILFFISCATPKPPKEDITKEDVILSLSQLWSEAEDYYGYWNLMDEDFDWDAAYYDCLKQVDQVKTDYDLYVLLQKLGAQLNDGHFVVIPQNGSIKDGGLLPISLNYIDGYYYVSGKTGLIRDIPLYSTVESINQLPTEQYLQEFIYPLIGSKTPGLNENKMADRVCQGKFGDSLEFVFKTPEGNQVTKKISFKQVNSGDLYTATTNNMITNYSSASYDVANIEGISYIKVKHLMDDRLIDEFPQIIELVENNKLIIDLPSNGGGNTAYGYWFLYNFVDIPKDILDSHMTATYQINSVYEMLLSQYLTFDEDYVDLSIFQNGIDKNFVQRGTSMRNNRYYLSPDNLTDKYILDYFDSNSQHIRNNLDEMLSTVQKTSIEPENIVILCDYFTGSAAESIISFAKAAGLTIIGTNTSGATGNIVEIKLAKEWKCMITAGQINLSDGTSIHNRGVLPTVFVETSFEDTKNGIDKILETAMNHLS